MRIMIVDDHPGVRNLIRQVTVSPDDAVCECDSGDEALRLAPEFKPDFVTMDVRMSGLCGIEATRRLRHAYPPARVAVVTSVDMPELRRAASEAGAYAFLSKEHLADLPTLMEKPTTSVSEPAASSVDPLPPTPAEQAEQLRHQLEELKAIADAVVQDLRVPLRAIGHSVNFLQAQGIRHHFASGDTHLARIYALTRNMEARLSHLQAATRSHPDSLKTVRVDPATLLHEAIVEVCPTGSQRELKLSIEPIPHVQADRALLRLLFIHWLSAAVENPFTGQPTPIAIGGRRHDREVIFSMQENRRARPDAGEPTQPFREMDCQGDFAGTPAESTNIRHLVQKLGGRIWARDAMDRGCSISFSLPAAV